MSALVANTVEAVAERLSGSADSLSNLFEPDVVLPSQFLVPDENGMCGGERKLMAAILSDGIEAYIVQSTVEKLHGRRRNDDAIEWVDTRDYSYVFSFDLVCESLGIDPEYLRLGLNRYVRFAHEQRRAGISSRSAWKKIRRPRKQ